MTEPTLLFDVMDIHKETKKWMEQIESPPANMLPNEKAAYEFGVRQTLTALKLLLYYSENYPLHYSGVDGIVEMDVEDLLKKEEDDLMEICSEEDEYYDESNVITTDGEQDR